MKFDFNKLEKIGEGAEKEVYIHPDNENKVVARFKENKENDIETQSQIKGRYYLTKILHLLFPKQIPDIHLSSKGEDTVIVSERKELDEPHNEHNKLRMSFKSNPGNDGVEYWKLNEEREEKLVWDDRYIDFLTAISSLGIRTDPSASNFGDDNDGNLVFVDNNFTPWFVNKNQIMKNYDPLRILELAKKMDVDKYDQVKSYINRLDQLFIEEHYKMNS